MFSVLNARWKMRRSIVAVMMVALSLLALPVSAQQAAKLKTGVRVRVTNVHGDKIVGNVARFDADSIQVAFERTGYVNSTPASDVRSIEVSNGTSHAAGFAKKGAIGLGVGVATGIAFGAFAYSGSNNGSFCVYVCSQG